MCQALNHLSERAPDWLRAHSQPEWVERYGPRVDEYRLPDSQEKRQALAELMGREGWGLLSAALDLTTPEAIRTLPAVETLRQIWIQNYVWENERLRWRTNDEIPPAAQYISSPNDVESHYAKKRSTSWVGYKVHVTETCEDEGPPHLITDVTTTIASRSDGDATPGIQQSLKAKALLPETQIVDASYIESDQLVSSSKGYGVDLIGPARADQKWQAQASQGFAAQDFKIDLGNEAGHLPSRASQFELDHGPVSTWQGRHQDQILDGGLYTPCPCRALCAHSQSRQPRRTITLPTEERYRALLAARARETTADYQALYPLRAGIEGTLPGHSCF